MNRKSGARTPAIKTSSKQKSDAAPKRERARMRRLALLPLIAATYFMVSGGPYGLEDIVGQAGYGRALLLLAVVPLVWSLPTALMIGELASAMPEEGGFYIWVTRAMGRFWGFEEAWLSLAASIFDMAIYPALAVAYLGQLSPALVAGERHVLWALAIVGICVAWNLRGAYSVGQGSLWMLGLLLLPFAGIVVCGVWKVVMHGAGVHGAMAWERPGGGSLGTALLFVVWNTMGWDNASTIAGEVERPQRNYIRAMLGAVALVTVSYIVPVLVVALAGIPAAEFVTGAWVMAARSLAGNLFGVHAGAWLGLAVVAGGALTGMAMFNALTLSYARVPAAMAEDGLLSAWLGLRMKNGVPWAAVLVCGAAWALASDLALVRLLELDILLYGLSLMLEFGALLMLRWREPELARPFRVPGGWAVVLLMSAAPIAVVVYTVWAARADAAGHFPAALLGVGTVVVGALIYPLTRGGEKAKKAPDAEV